MLTQEERHAFFHDGFFIKRQVFSQKDISEMQEGFNHVWETAQQHTPQQTGRVAIDFHGARFTYEAQALRHIAWCGKAHEILKRYGGDLRIRNIAADLLGSAAMEQLINQAHYKMPGDNISFPWHQDIEHRGAKLGNFTDINGKGSYVQIAIPLDNVTANNGPVGMIPGSCTLGHLTHEILDNGSKAIPDNLVESNKAVYPQPQTEIFLYLALTQFMAQPAIRAINGGAFLSMGLPLKALIKVIQEFCGMTNNYRSTILTKNRVTFLHAILLVILHIEMLPGQEIAQRASQNPLITSSSGKIGTNINGPSVIKVPKWVANRRGEYYMYFADHNGKYIRLASANKPTGPWRVEPEKILHLPTLDDSRFHGHIASPDVHVDNQRRQLVLYFHAPTRWDNK